MTDKELAQKLRTLAVDLDLSGRTADWHTVANAATRLEEIEAIRTHHELSERLSFWERWTMEWRSTAAVINRIIERDKPEETRQALALYEATRTAYQTELRAVLAKDPEQ